MTHCIAVLNDHHHDELHPDAYDLKVPSYTVPPLETQAKSSLRRRIFVGTGVTVVILGAIVGIVIALGKNGPAAIFIMEDPPGSDEVLEWPTQQVGGLEVFVMNSLEDRWTPIFDEYIAAWDNGQPDALTLTSSKYPHDADCDAYPGRVNVCNSDYGNTNWRGVNTAFIQNGFIVHSVTKLNDYHLDGGGEAQRKYTMCHELGHALGLPHTDTNYYNRNRGDCLDYTTRPQSNLSPGDFNFNLLFELYGSVNGRQTASPQALEVGDRALEADAAPHDVMEKYMTMVACLETMSCNECLVQSLLDHDGENHILHDNSHFEGCEFDLGQGYKVQTHKLLVA